MSNIVKIDLLIIDPQKDFVYLNPKDPNDKGSLFVAGADEDMKRLTAFVNRLTARSPIPLRRIHVTLDSHHEVDISHPAFWVNSKGDQPDHFTIIKVDDVEQGRWVPQDAALRPYAKDYAKALEKGGRYPICIWPMHCLIGTEGAAVDVGLRKALTTYAVKKKTWIDFVTKGSNPLTEHYSAIKAEVPDPKDASTQINTRLIKTLMECDEIIIAGEALSHCVANTVRDIANEFGNDDYVKKIVLLRDCTSSVTGFEKNGEDFIDEMRKRGMRLANSTDYMK